MVIQGISLFVACDIRFNDSSAGRIQRVDAAHLFRLRHHMNRRKVSEIKIALPRNDGPLASGKNFFDPDGYRFAKQSVLIGIEMDTVDITRGDQLGGVEEMAVEKSNQGLIVSGKQVRFFTTPLEHVCQKTEPGKWRRCDDQGLRFFPPIFRRDRCYNIQKWLDASGNIECRQRKSAFQIIRAQHDDNQVKWHVGFKTGKKIGLAVFVGTIDWVVVSGRSKACCGFCDSRFPNHLNCDSFSFWKENCNGQTTSD